MKLTKTNYQWFYFVFPYQRPTLISCISKSWWNSEKFYWKATIYEVLNWYSLTVRRKCSKPNNFDSNQLNINNIKWTAVIPYNRRTADRVAVASLPVFPSVILNPTVCPLPRGSSSSYRFCLDWQPSYFSLLSSDWEIEM
jgi:hypothetical protein